MLAYDDRPELQEHYLRIGDTGFYVPPTSIQVHKRYNHERAYLLRARNSLPTESGHYDQVVDITIYFPNMVSINNELRPLLAQLKKCPFLPIENTYLNDVYKIDAGTVSAVNVQTTPSFPNVLQANIQFYAFDISSYVYSEAMDTFDEMINWPLFRWHYQRNLDPDNEDVVSTYYEPLYDELDNSFLFRIAAEDDLLAIRGWREERRDLINKWREDKRKIFGRNEMEKEFKSSLNEIYESAIYEYDITYEEWPIPGLEMRSLGVGFENMITPLQIQSNQSPTHQYLGGQDTIITAQFMAYDHEVARSFQDLMTRSTDLIREYHKEVANGFLEFDNPLLRLFGVKNVTVDDIHTKTVEGHPDRVEITVTMIAYNRSAKKLHEIKALSLDIDWEIDPQDGMSIIAATRSPMHMDRFLSQRPGFERIRQGFSKMGDTTLTTDDAEKIAVYNSAVEETFLMSEVYPDLELPTYEEVEQAGFRVPNRNNGVFVDPDFFMQYDETTPIFSNLISEESRNEYEVEMRDGMGGHGKIKGLKASVEEEPEIAQALSNLETIRVKNQQIIEADFEFDEKLFDVGNISKEEMEGLIRSKAEIHNVDQRIAIATAKVYNENLFHFYEPLSKNYFNGHRVNESGVPVQKDEKGNYTGQTKEEIIGEYIGVMKVRPMYGSTVKGLGRSIEYNVEQGVKYLGKFLNDVNQLYEISNQSNQLKLEEENVFKAFDLNQNQPDDEILARAISAFLLYQGYEEEFMELIEEGKSLPTHVKQKGIVFKHEFRSSGRMWDRSEIVRQTENLQVKDYHDILAERERQMPVQSEDMYKDEDFRYGEMFSDMKEYDHRGRLVRAFPSFFMTFVDEGRFIGSVKMSDQFFHFSAIEEMIWNKSRKTAAGTLTMKMSNVFGTLDDAVKSMDLTHTSYGEIFMAMLMPGRVAKNADRSRLQNSTHYKSIMLRTGVRVHLRMGYGSNPLKMPIIMNGPITHIENHDEMIEVIAQDDGIELGNKLRADVDDVTKPGGLHGLVQARKDPTEIVDEILTDSQGFFNSLWRTTSRNASRDHSLGINHFGDFSYPQSWDNVMGYAQGLGIFGIFTSNVNRTIQEINMNVYPTTGLLHGESEGFFTKLGKAFGFGKASEDSIQINLFDKTPWDILNVAASMGEDHIVSTHPFGFQTTVFSGPAYFPLTYGYKTDGESIIGPKMKPFRQVHSYDSDTSILKNAIIATEDNMRTVAVGVYMNEGEMDTTPPIYVDTSIWTEKQRTVNLDTTLNATGIRALEIIPLIGGLLNKPFKWHHDEGVAIKIAARGLSDYVRDMYDGYLTVMGDPSVKPHDLIYLFDRYNDMNGPAHVKEVTQMFNVEQGFITLIKPDACVINSDQNNHNMIAAMAPIVTYAAIRGMTGAFMASRGKASSLPVLNAMWAGTKAVGGMAKRQVTRAVLPLSRVLKDTLTGKKAKNSQRATQAANNRARPQISNAVINKWAASGQITMVRNGVNISPDGVRAIAQGRVTPATATGEVIRTINNTASGDVKRIGSSTTPSTSTGTNASRGRRAGRIALAGFRGLRLGTPIGWVTLAAEAAVVHFITSAVGEFTERRLLTRQACIIAPLTKGGVEFTAGLNGHKGSVVTDSPSFMRKVMTSNFSSVLMSGFGADMKQFRPATEEEVIGIQSTPEDVERINNDAIMNIYETFGRVKPRSFPGLKEMYEEDVKEAQNLIDARTKYFEEKYNRRPEHEEDDLEGEIGIFRNLFQNIMNLFTGGGDQGFIGEKCRSTGAYKGKYASEINAASKRHGVDANLIAGIIERESNFNNSVTSHAGAQGLMQLMPATARGLGVTDTFNASQNINGGAKYIAQQLEAFDYDLEKALAAYNAGSGNVRRWIREGTWPSIPFQETRRYVPNVIESYKKFERQYGAGCERVDLSSVITNCPPDVSTSGRASQQLTETQARSTLIDARSNNLTKFRIHMVGPRSMPLMRQGSFVGLNKVAEMYRRETGKQITLTSAYRRNNPTSWHGTGWAVDINTPNNMRWIRNKLRFPEGRDKREARFLADACAAVGFRGIYFGDFDIVNELNRKYGSGTAIYETEQHHNHLHLSYPICSRGGTSGPTNIRQISL